MYDLSWSCPILGSAPSVGALFRCDLFVSSRVSAFFCGSRVWALACVPVISSGFVVHYSRGLSSSRIVGLSIPFRLRFLLCGSHSSHVAARCVKLAFSLPYVACLRLSFRSSKWVTPTDPKACHQAILHWRDRRISTSPKWNLKVLPSSRWRHGTNSIFRRTSR
jgi:hypothetical protein